MSKNLMQGLLDEIDRVEDIITEYKDPLLKGSGELAASFMEVTIQTAKDSIAEGDTVKMLYAYNELITFTL